MRIEIRQHGNEAGINAVWATSYPKGQRLKDQQVIHNGNTESNKPITWQQLKMILHWAWIQYEVDNALVVIDIFGHLDQWAEKMAKNYPQASPRIIIEQKQAAAKEELLDQHWQDVKEKLKRDFAQIGDPTRNRKKNKAPNRSKRQRHS